MALDAKVTPASLRAERSCVVVMCFGTLEKLRSLAEAAAPSGSDAADAALESTTTGKGVAGVAGGGGTAGAAGAAGVAAGEAFAVAMAGAGDVGLGRAA